MSGLLLPLWPPPCTFLHPGQVFKEAPQFLLGNEEHYKVNIMLMECDTQKGELSGYLASGPVQKPEKRVVKFWRGEIVDNMNYGFISADEWGVSAQSDVKNWASFPEFLPRFKTEVRKDGGRALDLASYPFMFMRWKEKYFVELIVEDADGPKFRIMDTSSVEYSEMKMDPGFYYMCFSRSDGSMRGFFCEPTRNRVLFPMLKFMVTHRHQCNCQSGGKTFARDFF